MKAISRIAFTVAAPFLFALPSHAQSVSRATAAPSSSLAIVGTHTFNGFTLIAPAAGRLMAFDALTVPADGAVTPAGCWKVGPLVSGDTSNMTSMGNVSTPVLITIGLVLVFSDYIDAVAANADSCFTLHKATAEFIEATYQ